MEQRQNSFWLALGLIACGAILLVGIGDLLLTLIFGVTLVLPGLGFWYAYRLGHQATAPLAIPALLIGGTGAILMFQSITGYWESWVYAWTLYSVFLGYGLMLMGQRLEENNLVQVGRILVLLGGLGFVALGSVYILLTTPFLRYLLAFAAFVAGGYLLLKNQEEAPAKRKIGQNAQRLQINLDDSEAA